MNKYTKDPLLTIGTIIVLIGQGAMAIAALALVLAIPGVALFRDAITSQLRSSMEDPAFVFPLIEVTGIMLMALVVALLMFAFFELLRRIIATVGEGDPFQPVNATRLTKMAWLMLAVELMTFPIAGLAMRLIEIFEDVAGQSEVVFGLDISSIVMIITLFILARVFRKGAEMRDELEGTV